MEKEYYPIFSQRDYLYIVLFFVSFANSILGSIFMLSLFLYLKSGPEGGVKALLLLTTRGLMSSAVATSLDSNIKWIVLIGISIWMIIGYGIDDEDKKKLSNVIAALSGFLLAAASGAVFNSSYPLTSIFKMISFALPFVAVMKGIAVTRRYCRWMDYFSAFYLMLFAISAVLIPYGRFIITNSDFQGVFNHVNILGIICAITIAAFLESNLFRKKTLIRSLVVITILIMCYLSASRTGMFSALAVLGVYFLCSRGEGTSKIKVVVLVGVLFIAIWLSMGGEIQQLVNNFVWKNSTNSIMDSRLQLIEMARTRYESHKLMGTGFMVPYNEGAVDWSLNFNLIVEPGNLVWMLLGDTGIVGASFFGILVFAIFKNGTWSRLHLLVGAFIVNMGEMVFFSSNNMSILIYFLIAVYLFEDNTEVEYV